MTNPIERFIAERGITRCRASAGRAPSPEAVELEWLRRNRRDPIAAAGSMARWYAVAVWPSREYRVRDLLVQDGFEVWLPECVVIRRLGNRLTNRRRADGPLYRAKGPLLPGYLLARVDLGRAQWRRIAETRWVDGMLGANDHPSALADRDITALRALVERHGGLVELDADQREKRAWRNGEAVRIIGELFGGFGGLYVAPAGTGHIKISLDIAGATRVVTLPEALVVPA